MPPQRAAAFPEGPDVCVVWQARVVRACLSGSVLSYATQQKWIPRTGDVVLHEQGSDADVVGFGVSRRASLLHPHCGGQACGDGLPGYPSGFSWPVVEHQDQWDTY